jgi:hypothetical protein
MLEVLVGFLRRVAAQSDGNRMDASNLAVVFAPNILYAKPSKDKDKTAGDRTALAKDESLVAIEVVKQIIEHQDCLWQVPDEIIESLAADEDAVEQKDRMRKTEALLTSSKRSHSTRELFSSGSIPSFTPMFSSGNTSAAANVASSSATASNPQLGPARRP